MLHCLITSFFLTLLINTFSQKIDYFTLKNAQDLTIPLFKNEETNKSALFLFPHADDEITCAGTINQLKNDGWIVNLITFTTGSSEKDKTFRKEEWKECMKILKIDRYELFDLLNNTWQNVLANNISFWNDHLDSVENIIYQKIIEYKPSILFTYDTILGAYGHPEHRLSALAAFHVFKKFKDDPSFPVTKIFQVTIPEKLELLLLSEKESYKNAKKHTGNQSLPEPNIAFDIINNWPAKQEAAKVYKSQFNVLNNFYMIAPKNETDEHYSTFCREYFFMITR